MPRVMVISDEQGSASSVLLDEQVSSIHLDSEHSAWQFIERLGWAISDAEDAEQRRLAAAPSVERARIQLASAGPRTRQSLQRHTPRAPRHTSPALRAAS